MNEKSLLRVTNWHIFLTIFGAKNRIWWLIPLVFKRIHLVIGSIEVCFEGYVSAKTQSSKSRLHSDISEYLSKKSSRNLR